MFPTKETIEMLRTEYPDGTRVRLVKMDDVQAPPIGTEGTVVGVDGIGSLIMHWDNGSSLHVVYAEDEFDDANIAERAKDILDNLAEIFGSDEQED